MAAISVSPRSGAFEFGRMTADDAKNMRPRLNHKFFLKASRYGGAAFFILAVVGNRGLGKITHNNPAVHIGEVGFLSMWCLGVGTLMVTGIRHRRGFKRLGARAKQTSPEHRSFRLTWGGKS
jgi:hypothetical protein